MHVLRMLASFFSMFLILVSIEACGRRTAFGPITIRPSRFSKADSILQRPDFDRVLRRFEALHQSYFELKHHQFHHKNAPDLARYEGSYGLGPWDYRGGDLALPGNREEINATPYPLPGVAADIALAYLHAYKATQAEKYAQAAIRILDNFLQAEQVQVLKSHELVGEELSLMGSFTNWQIRAAFPNRYSFAGRYLYKNATPPEQKFESLYRLSIPPVSSHGFRSGYDSIGFQAQLHKGTILPYSGQIFTDTGNEQNTPHPDATARAVQAYAEAILQEFPRREEYLKIIGAAAYGLYGFELGNQWGTPATEIGSRVSGLVAVVRAFQKHHRTTLSGQPAWPLEELLRDACLRVQNVADPDFRGWFQGWTPGGPAPNRTDWWLIQSGPDFFGTTVLDEKRYPWLLMIHDKYDDFEDNQLWYFSQVLQGIANFYPFLLAEPDTKKLRQTLRDFLCQGFNYFLQFQDTTQNPLFRGGIDPEAYSVREFAMNQQNFMHFENGSEAVIKRFSHRYFGAEAFTYPFPDGLQAAMIAALNIPELRKPLQPLIYSGMNHLLACDFLFQVKLKHQELEPLRNWLAPEIFKTLALYLVYVRQ
ncbi:hypothetical protein L0128_07635 [candidate division KSB1 bacterium]|nr:hypothetical protein [candidate division KSB1 bacterium]